MVANASSLTGSIAATNDAAPDTTDHAELAAFCERWRLDPDDPRVVFFLDLARRDGVRHTDWTAGWRCWSRSSPREEPQDELDGLSTVSGITSLALAELGMPETAQVLGFADATVARIAANASTLTTTQIAAGLRVPALKDAIRAKRLAARAASPRSSAAVPLSEANVKDRSAPRP